MITKECIRCGKKFCVKPYRKNKARFCSIKCSSIGNAKKGEYNPFYGKHHTKETCKKISERQKGKSHSEETKQKMSKTRKGKHHTKETRQKISDAQRGIKNHSWKGGDIKIICKVCGKEKTFAISEVKRNYGKFCSLRCSAIFRMRHQKTHNTDIERLIEDELIRRNVPYTTQVSLLGITLVDFLLPNDIVIYCDGIYWHSLQKTKERDINQDFMLKFYGYKVFRFTNIEIKKSPKKCIDKIIKVQRHSNGHVYPRKCLKSHCRKYKQKGLKNGIS